MKRNSTIFLQGVVTLIGLVVLAALLWEPHLEGVNVNKGFFEVYADPFILYAYLGSVAFFVGLFQGFKLLQFIGRNEVFSLAAIKAVRTIKYCAFILAGAIIAADVYLGIMARTNGEDAAGAIMLGFIATAASIIVGTVAGLFERILQNAPGRN